MKYIEGDDLDKVNKCASQDPDDELLFLTLLSTGLQIGAYVKMKVLDVAELVNHKWQAKTQVQQLKREPKCLLL